MNEQKYTEIMQGIRREYIDEAVTWDGSEQKRSREIRFMTIGICGIAASIAVIAGFLFLNTRNKPQQKITAPPALSETEQNFLGGYGELKPYLGTNGSVLLCDNENRYLLPRFNDDDKRIQSWKEPTQEELCRSQAVVLRDLNPDFTILSDGERMYQADYRDLRIIDSSGKTTEFFTLTPDCPLYNTSRDMFSFYDVQHLSGDYYVIRYYSYNSIQLTYDQFEAYYKADTKKVFAARSVGYVDPCALPDGTGYYLAETDSGMICRYSFEGPDFCEQIVPIPDHMRDCKFVGNMFYYSYAPVTSDSDAHFVCCRINLNTKETETVAEIAGGRFYFGDEIYTEQYTGAAWSLTSRPYGTGTQESTLFYAEGSQLWDYHNNPGTSGTEINFIAADDQLIFTMAQPNRFAYEYAVKNRGSSDLTVIDLYYLRHDDNEFMDDSSYGYVTESDEFPRLYIPPEHTAERLDEIQCYRMLPYRNAWESELDPSVFFGFNENRGDAPRITKERAMEICYESSSFLEAAQKLLEEGGWDVAWTSGIIGEEIWLDDRGKELIFVHQFDGITYYRYDETARQYYFERLRGDDSGSADSKQPDQPDSTVSANEPQYYEFTEWEVRTDGYHDGVQYPQVFFIRSRAELDDYIERNKSLYQFEFAEGGDSYYSFVEAAARYPESWFEDHQLILVLLEEGSGSIRHSLADLSDTGLTVIRTVPEVGTDDMAEWHLFIETDKANTFAAPEDFTVSFETRQ